MRSRTITYAPEISVDDAAGRWILEAVGAIRQLARGSARRRYGSTHKRELVRIFAISDLCRRTSTWHPIGNFFERLVTPRTGTMFGCVNCFDITAPWWKSCWIHECLRTGKGGIKNTPP